MGTLAGKLHLGMLFGEVPVRESSQVFFKRFEFLFASCFDRVMTCENRPNGSENIDIRVYAGNPYSRPKIGNFLVNSSPP
jgi:hypothetical protein